MLSQYTIRDFNNHTHTFEEFLKSVKWHVENGYSVYVGSDSRIIKDNIYLATAICFHAPGIMGTTGRTGKVFTVTENVKRKLHPTLKARMLLEANRSIQVAMELEPYVYGKIEVHLDIGTTIKSKTSAYEEELKSLVMSQGYNCQVKPESWASFAADLVTR